MRPITAEVREAMKRAEEQAKVAIRNDWHTTLGLPPKILLTLIHALEQAEAKLKAITDATTGGNTHRLQKLYIETVEKLEEREEEVQIHAMRIGHLHRDMDELRAKLATVEAERDGLVKLLADIRTAGLIACESLSHLESESCIPQNKRTSNNLLVAIGAIESGREQAIAIAAAKTRLAVHLVGMWRHNEVEIGDDLAADARTVEQAGGLAALEGGAA